MVISSPSTPWHFLLPIILLLIITISCSADDALENGDPATNDHYVAHICSSSPSASESITHLVEDLANTASTPGNGGFSNSSQPWDQGTVYGLAQCRGDVSNDECNKCVNDAASDVINTYCPNSRSATMWHDYCELKYSDVDFLGKFDTDHNLTITNGKSFANESRDAHAAEDMLWELVEQVKKKSTNLFASGSTLHKPLEIPLMYGVVQCTGDVSKGDCTNCLERALSDISACCRNDNGVRVLYGACNVRREIYAFLKKV